MSGAECLARLRADAAALSPRAAHIALALLPAVDHLPDAWKAGLHKTLTHRASASTPLSPIEFDAIRVTAAGLPHAYPEWVVTDPEHPKARELIVNAWETAKRYRSGPGQSTPTPM
ncbi:hypothetical protein [Variovorax paradoxus]|uniref:hypothetical protein n=1 Tax=Variovorax paradoxus TaxID=34073 RepID=UPI002480AF33|nr:hypothetical protein [Variovorax paradoxus]WGT65212.1 hypothetical protein QHG62_07665 [Variovorax paradoxus]